MLKALLIYYKVSGEKIKKTMPKIQIPFGPLSQSL